MKGRLEAHVERMEIEEVVARVFLALGLLWWSLASIGAWMSGHTEVFYGLASMALVTAVALAVGWRFERTAAALLAVSAAALVGLGLYIGWEAGVWAGMTITVIAPMVGGAALLFAAREEKIVIERSTRELPVRGAHA